MAVPLQSDLVVGSNVAGSISPLGELGLGDVIRDIGTKKNTILSVINVLQRTCECRLLLHVMNLHDRHAESALKGPTQLQHRH